MNDNVITSVQNARIKHLLSLQQKSSERRKEGVFVVEGTRELQHCIEAGYKIEEVFCCSDIIGGRMQELTEGCRKYLVSQYVYDKIAYRGGTEGVVAIVQVKTAMLEDFDAASAPLLLVLEGVEKPGNLGAILRSADAAGVDGVIVCDALTDLYNPNVIRSSIGAVFCVPCVVCSSEECIAWLKQNDVQILTAQLQDSSLYYDISMKGATAIVMGTESTGLTDMWRRVADAHIRIPMLGRLDSLNVSVSAAILMYEAVRQRGDHPQPLLEEGRKPLGGYGSL